MVSQPEGITVRDWTDILARVRFGTLPTRARKGRSAGVIKAVAHGLARYANYHDGRRVFPGLVRLALELEWDYDTVKDCVGVLRKLGLLRLTRRATGPGDTSRYELAIP